MPTTTATKEKSMWADRFETFMKIVVAVGIALLIAGFLMDPANVLGGLAGTDTY